MGLQGTWERDNLFDSTLPQFFMIKMEIKIFIKDVIINESGHLSTFLEGQNSQIFFNMYFLSLIQVFSLNVFYNVFF